MATCQVQKLKAIRELEGQVCDGAMSGAIRELEGQVCDGAMSGAGNRRQPEQGEALKLSPRPQIFPAGLQVHMLCLDQPGTNSSIQPGEGGGGRRKEKPQVTFS